MGWTEWEVLAKLILLMAIWASPVAKPTVSFKDFQRKHLSINGEGGMMVEGKGMSKWVMLQGKYSIILVPQEKLRTRDDTVSWLSVADARK